MRDLVGKKSKIVMFSHFYFHETVMKKENNLRKSKIFILKKNSKRGSGQMGFNDSKSS